MKSYDELKADMELIQQHIDEVNKNERTKILKDENRFWKDFAFTVAC